MERQGHPVHAVHDVPLDVNSVDQRVAAARLQLDHEEAPALTAHLRGYCAAYALSARPPGGGALSLRLSRGCIGRVAGPGERGGDSYGRRTVAAANAKGPPCESPGGGGID